MTTASLLVVVYTFARQDQVGELIKIRLFHVTKRAYYIRRFVIIYYKMTSNKYLLNNETSTYVFKKTNKIVVVKLKKVFDKSISLKEGRQIPWRHLNS